MRGVTSAVVALLWTTAFALGCGGGEKGPQSAAEVQVFCDSYEESFIGNCRQSCESGLSAGDTAGTKTCIRKCQSELGADEHFQDDCPHRATLYSEAGAK